MDEISEKKWFVYVGDKHEGPYSVGDILGLIDDGKATRDNFVWKEGMADWKPIPEVDDFSRKATPPAAPATQPQLKPQMEIQIEPQEDVGGEIILPELMTKEEATGATAQPEPSLTLSFVPNGASATADSSAGIEVIPTVKADIGKVRKEEVQVAPASSSPGETTQEFEMPKIRSRLRSTASAIALALVLVFGLYQSGIFRNVAGQGGMDAAAESGRSFVSGLITQYPQLSFLGQYVSPIPALTDISAQEFADLKAIAQSGAKGSPVQIGLGLSTSDRSAPSFYVSSSSSDPMQLHVHVVGIPDTLLNQTYFVGDLEVNLDKHLGKTAGLRGSDGQPVPRGEYYVSVVTTEGQTGLPQMAGTSALPAPQNEVLGLPVSGASAKDIKVLASKKYFLGGPNDQMYTARLKDYHDKLQAKAATELAEIRQFLATLDSQLNSTQTKFALLRKGKRMGANRKQWDAFHLAWTNLETQLNSETAKWTLEMISQELFYGSLYQLIQQGAVAVQKMHEVHHAFFVGVPDLKSFELQLGAASSAAASALNLLRAKADAAGKLSPTPSGMPRRDGL